VMTTDATLTFLAYSDDEAGSQGSLVVVSDGVMHEIPSLTRWRSSVAVDRASRRDGWLLLSGSRRHCGWRNARCRHSSSTTRTPTHRAEES
jgi:hypothetical protein